MAQLTIHTVADLVTAVPTQLGYQPTESLVMVAMQRPPQRPESWRIASLAAVDVPIPAHRNTTATYHELARRQHAEMVALVAYTADQELGRAAIQQAIAALSPAMVWTTAIASLSGVTWVDPENPDVVQWTDPWSRTHSNILDQLQQAGADPGTFTRTLTDLTEEYGTTPAALPSWPSALAQAIAAAAEQGTPDEIGRNPTAERDRWKAEIREWVQGRLRAAQTPGGPEVGQIGAGQAAYALARICWADVRDAAWLTITAENARAQRALWLAVARHAGHTKEALPAVFLAGFAAGLAGDSAIARVLLHRLEALPHAADYSATRTLSHVLSTANWRQIWEHQRSSTLDHDGNGGHRRVADPGDNP